MRDTNMSDYDKVKNTLKDFKKFYIGQEVMTEHGVGIIVRLEIPTNGLYICQEIAECTVWFGTEDSKDGWVKKSFNLTEIKGIDLILKIVSEMDYSSFMHSIIKYVEENGDPKECSCAGTGFYPLMCCDGDVCGCGGQPVNFELKCPECGKEAPKKIPDYATYNILHIPVIPERP
jgi:hypothetical protein